MPTAAVVANVAVLLLPFHLVLFAVVLVVHECPQRVSSFIVCHTNYFAASFSFVKQFFLIFSPFPS